MADFLTRRNGTWHFVRRVPREFSDFDARGVIRHSTKIRVSADRTGRRATRVADKLEAYWPLRRAWARHCLVRSVPNPYHQLRRILGSFAGRSDVGEFGFLTVEKFFYAYDVLRRDRAARQLLLNQAHDLFP